MKFENRKTIEKNQSKTCGFCGKKRKEINKPLARLTKGKKKT